MAVDLAAPAPHGIGTVRFTAEDMALFTAASHDRNPLHVDPVYSRRSPYGEPIVYGVLAGLAAAGAVAERPGRHVTRMVLDFPGALFCGIDYRVVVADQQQDAATVVLYDGRRVVLRAALTFADGAPADARLPGDAPALRRDAADQGLDDLEPGVAVRFRYAPRSAAVERLVTQYRLASRGFGGLQLGALLCASYLAGMELPGRRGLCLRIAVDVDQDGPPVTGPLAVAAGVARAHPRVNAVDIAATLTCANRPVARIDVRGFVRGVLPVPSSGEGRGGLMRSDALAGKCALVIGGSRGLGAAVARALAMQGATVFVAYQCCDFEAETVRRDVRAAGGRVELLRGDAADVAWCAHARARVSEVTGGLDILVCGAAPPLRPLSVHAATVSRVVSYVARSVALVAAPLATFVDEIDQRAGAVVVVSAGALDDPPADWHHYVAAKHAVEGLARAAVAGRGGVRLMVSRPPPMRTDFSNAPTAVGRTPPEHVADGIVRDLVEANTAAADRP